MSTAGASAARLRAGTGSADVPFASRDEPVERIVMGAVKPQATCAPLASHITHRPSPLGLLRAECAQEAHEHSRASGGGVTPRRVTTIQNLEAAQRLALAA